VSARASSLACAAIVLAAVVGLTGCEKPQVSQQTKRKPDVAAYQGTDNAFADTSWKRGDSAAWEEQLRKRSQGQNEYSRASQP
jgi:major membrane immunogen (membrane-anchored lipoprotein)